MFEEVWFLPDERSDREPVLASTYSLGSLYYLQSLYSILQPTLFRQTTSIAFLSEAQGQPGTAANGKVDLEPLRLYYNDCSAASAAPSRVPRHTNACAAIRTITSNLHYAHW